MLFFGDSDIARWDAEQCFPEIETVKCGVSGSLLSDAADFASYATHLFQPAFVVLVAGENDLCEDQSPEDVLKDLHRCVVALTNRDQELHVFYISAKLEPVTLELREVYKEYNQLAKTYCDATEGVTFIDCYSAMLLSARGRVDGAAVEIDETPEPEPVLFADDGLHLSAEGYRTLRQLLLEALEAHGARY
jgi:lysophospholipase L1-like esterase